MNQIRNTGGLAVALILLFSMGSCKKSKEASPIPEIEFSKYEFMGNDSLVLTFHFIDGDGDIGLLPGDTVSPYNEDYLPGDPLYIYKYMNGLVLEQDSFNRNGFNLILTYEELVDGDWETPELSPFLLYRIRDISPTGQDPYLEGDINIDLNYPSLISSENNDSVRYSIELQDRALNTSNIVETGLITRP